MLGTAWRLARYGARQRGAVQGFCNVLQGERVLTHACRVSVLRQMPGGQMRSGNGRYEVVQGTLSMRAQASSAEASQQWTVVNGKVFVSIGLFACGFGLWSVWYANTHAQDDRNAVQADMEAFMARMREAEKRKWRDAMQTHDDERHNGEGHASVKKDVLNVAEQDTGSAGRSLRASNDDGVDILESVRAWLQRVYIQTRRSLTHLRLAVSGSGQLFEDEYLHRIRCGSSREKVFASFSSVCKESHGDEHQDSERYMGQGTGSGKAVDVLLGKRTHIERFMTVHDLVVSLVPYTRGYESVLSWCSDEGAAVEAAASDVHQLYAGRERRAISALLRRANGAEDAATESSGDEPPCGLLLDLDGNGLISYAEYSFFLSLLISGDSQMRLIFDYFDESRDGGLSRKEFIHAFAVHMGKCEEYGDAECDVVPSSLVQSLYPKGQDSLSYDAFRGFVTDMKDEVLRAEYEYCARLSPRSSGDSEQMTLRDLGLFLIGYHPKRQMYYDAVRRLPENVRRAYGKWPRWYWC